MKIRWPRLLTPTQLCQIIRSQKNPLTALQIFKEVKSKYPNYSHNGPVYATLISILGNSGRIAEMKQVIDLMKEDPSECKDSVFVIAIKSYAKAGLLDESIRLFRSLPQFNCVNWTESFNTIMQIMVEQSKFKIAFRLFEENSYGWGVKSRIRSLNLLIHALCERNCPNHALQVFEEMNKQCCYPTKETYFILMKGLCDDGRLNEATHLLYSMLWRISQKGSGEDVVIYRTLLNALCDNGQVQEAVDILGKVLRKGVKGTKRCRKHLDLKECGSIDDIEHVKGLINEALITGGIPSMASYGAVAIDLYSQGNVTDADKVFDVMLARGFRPSLLMYEAKVTALCEEGRIYEAVGVIEKEMAESNCVPTVKVYNLLMKGLCDEGKSTLAVEYLEKMARQLGCVPNKETYHILVNGLCHERKFVNASRVLEGMVAKSYWPSLDTYNALIRGLCFMGRKYEAVMWLEEMVSECKIPDIFVWDALVVSVCRAGEKTDGCSHTLDQLTSST